MARKRLNTRFLIAAALPVFILISGLVAWKILPKMFPSIRWVLRGTPAQHMAKGRALYDDAKYEAAGEEFRYAIYMNGSTPDAEMATAVGDCYAHMVTIEVENLARAKQWWDKALSINPTYMPALQRMLDLLLDDATINRGGGARLTQQWDGVYAAAGKILAIDPKDRKARTAQFRAVITKWLAKVETPPEQVEKAMNGLVAVSQEQPFDADTLFYVMQAMWQRAQDRLMQNDRAGADGIMTDVVGMVDKALELHGDDALMHYRAGQALNVVGTVQRTANQPSKYADRTRDELKKAAEMVKPDHKMYAEIKHYYGKHLESLNDLAGAEAAYKSLLTERPDEINVRISLGELVSRNPARRSEAVAILEQAPPPDPTRNAGMKAFAARQQELTALFDLINIKLDMLSGLKGEPSYDVLLKQIDDGFAKLMASPGVVADSPLGLQTRGRIELAKGQNLQAVQTLDRALNLMPGNPSGNEAEAKARLQFFMAGAYMLTDQSGQAESLLKQIIQSWPQFVPARVLFTQLLIKQGRQDEAKEQTDMLSKAMPDNPTVTRMAIYSLDKEKDKDQINQFYDKLPQTRPDEWLDKANVAVYLERRDDAIKLYEQYRTAVPTDLSANVALARVYAAIGDMPKATSLMDDAIAKLPDNVQLKFIRAEIMGTDVKDVRADIIEATKDPFSKALMQYEWAIQQGRRDEAGQYLDAAAKINPADGRVLELQFNRALSQKNWDLADKNVELLAKQNRDMVGGLLYRVRFAVAKGDLNRANDLALELVRQMPEFGQSYVVLGQVQKSQKKYADAISSFEQALQKQAQNRAAINELISISYLVNDPVKAKSYIALGRKTFPNDSSLRESELAHEIRFGDPEKVIAPREEMLKKAIANKDSGEYRAWGTLAEAYVAAARSKDNPQAARPLFEKARDTLAQACSKFPDSIDLVAIYSDTLLQLKSVSEGEKVIQTLRALPKYQGKPEATLLLANYYSRAAKPAEQEKVLREYLATTPNAVPVQLALSSLLADQNKLADAIKVLDVNAAEPDIRRQRIELQINAGHMTEAQAELKAVFDITPNPSSVLLNRQAFIYMKSGRATEALATLEKSLAQSPTDLEAQFMKGTIYLASRRNLDQAIGYLQAARDSHFKELQSRTSLADAFHYSGDDESAIRELEDAVHLFPNDKSSRLRLLGYYASIEPKRWSQAERLIRDTRALPQFANDIDLMQIESSMWLQRNNPSRATEVIVAAMKLAPDRIELNRTYSQALLANKDFTGILRSTDAMVKAKKAPWWIYDFRGRARRGLDDKQAALDEFQAGIDLASANGDDAATATIVSSIDETIGASSAIPRIYDRAEKGENNYRLMLVNLMQKSDDLPNAISWAEKVTADSKATPEQLDTARRLLGGLYLRLNPPNMAKAVQIYQKLLERNPNDLVSLNNLACTMILPNSGFTAKDAKVYSDRAFKIIEASGQVNAYIYDTQGYVLVLNGQNEDGIRLLQQAVDKEPIAEACYHLGLAYMASPTPRTSDAQDSYKQALALLDAASKDNKPADADLKSKIEKDLDRANKSATTKPDDKAP